MLRALIDSSRGGWCVRRIPVRWAFASSACRTAIGRLLRRRELRYAYRHLHAERAFGPAGREFLRATLRGPIGAATRKRSCRAGSGPCDPGRNIPQRLRVPKSLFHRLEMVRRNRWSCGARLWNGGELGKGVQKRSLTGAVRPISAIFSPRTTLAVKLRITSVSSYDLVTPSSSRMCLPEGRFCSNFK